MIAGPVTHGLPKRVFFALLLGLCLAIHVLEVSGGWDRTFRDANDEAAIVAIVFCVGAAVCAAATLMRVDDVRRAIVPGVVTSLAVRLSGPDLLILPTLRGSPPLALRI